MCNIIRIVPGGPAILLAGQAAGGERRVVVSVGSLQGVSGADPAHRGVGNGSTVRPWPAGSDSTCKPFPTRAIRTGEVLFLVIAVYRIVCRRLYLALIWYRPPQSSSAKQNQQRSRECAAGPGVSTKPQGEPGSVAAPGLLSMRRFGCRGETMVANMALTSEQAIAATDGRAAPGHDV
jgi:hypothetical protein